MLHTKVLKAVYRMLGTRAFLYLLECMKKFEGNFQLESMKLEKKMKLKAMQDLTVMRSLKKTRVCMIGIYLF